jgi:oligopeptide transport system substrate-binding protein
MLRFAAIPRLYVVFMDTAKKPFDDVRVRKAFYLALDRGKLAELYDGLLAPAWTLTPHLISSHSKNIRLAGTPDDARRFLADAGYPNGAGFPPITMVVRATQVEQLFSQASQSMWKQVLNVDVKLQVLDAQAFRAWRVAIQKQPYDLFNTSSTADIPDAWVYHNFLFGTDYFSSRWRNPRYLELAGRAERELNLQRRDELYQQLDRMVVEEDTVVIPWSNDQIAYLVRPAFKGLGIIFGTQGPSLTELQVVP